MTMIFSFISSGADARNFLSDDYERPHIGCGSDLELACGFPRDKNVTMKFPVSEEA
jgi:hypothetical protein